MNDEGCVDCIRYRKGYCRGCSLNCNSSLCPKHKRDKIKWMDSEFDKLAEEKDFFLNIIDLQ